jgi:ubiquinone/menaquinone biosynthesis C-methylase UbiE
VGYLTKYHLHTHLPFGCRSFPVIICHGVFPHFEDKSQALTDLRRVLQPGGQLIILHDISREQVNAIHHELPSPLSDDLIPPAGQMEAWLDQAGFIDVWVEDTPDYYLAEAGVCPKGSLMACGAFFLKKLQESGFRLHTKLNTS